MKKLILLLMLTGCCAPSLKPALDYDFEKELKMKRRSWVFRYKNKPGVTLMPTNDVYWLIEQARR